MSHDANPFHEYPPGLKIDHMMILHVHFDVESSSQRINHSLILFQVLLLSFAFKMNRDGGT
jgi:hypothetical protein